MFHITLASFFFKTGVKPAAGELSTCRRNRETANLALSKAAVGDMWLAMWLTLHQTRT